jgi:death-on-curing protein
MRTPTRWLNLRDSRHIFENFKKALETLGEPIPPFESRFPGKLEGILESVRQTFDGSLLNPTVLDAAAAYFNQLIRGHPLQNGNKRMAVLFTHYFLLAHGVDFTMSYNELFFFAITVAKAGEQKISSDKTRDWCKKIIERFTK